MADFQRMVALLFTDVKGSVALWRRQGHLMERLIDRHDRIIEMAVLRCRGRPFKTVGDAVLAKFETAGQALEAAQMAQETLAAEDWSVDGEEAEPLQVRMAVHSGAVIVHRDDYLGTEVNRTARLLDRARPGQILVSKAAEQLAREELPVGTELIPLGLIRLKDFGDEEVFELIATAARPQFKKRVASAPRPRRGGDRADGDGFDGADDLDGTDPPHPASPEPSSVDAFLQQRIDLWTGPIHDLDNRFAPVSIRLAEWSCGDAGWSGESARFDDLWTALTALPHRSVVLLGEPGSGKSTLLRHLDMVLAQRRAAEGSGPIPFYVELNRCRLGPDEDDGSALSWLESQWAVPGLGLPPLSSVMRQPGVVFLLDGLDELPKESKGLDRSSILRWKRFVQDTLVHGSPSRAILSCRTQDYSPPLSTPSRAVPILYTEALDDEQIRAFIDAHSSRDAGTRTIIENWDVNGLMRNPYSLRLAIDHVTQHKRLPTGRAELFATLVRQVTRREIEREHPLFRSGGVLSDRDIRRTSLSLGWTSSHALPDDTGLFTALGEFAHELAAQMGSGGRSHVEMDRHSAEEILGSTDMDFLDAGTALGLLVENPEFESYRFTHLLILAFLAARLWLREPRIDLIERPFLKSDVSPEILETLESLSPSDVLPPIAPSVWEDIARLAAEMTADQSAFVMRLAKQDLALAGRAVADSGVEVSPQVERDLRDQLVRRLGDPAVDLRARIEAANVLGMLGDPRFVYHEGEHGAYHEPPMVQLPGGSYPIGADEREALFEGPCRHIEINAFGIGRYPVTVSEYTRFMEAGGYEDERWWSGAAASAWREGIATGEPLRSRDRGHFYRFREHPEELDLLFQRDVMPQRVYERWRTRIRWSVEEFEAQNLADHPDVRHVEPSYWNDLNFRTPTRPIVGVSWFEARAYCAWLAAQTGRPYRLPTEMEIEAASRGLEDREHPWGAGPPTAAMCNIAGTHIQGTTPVGVFPESKSPEGVADLLGNVLQWTASAWGHSRETCDFPYPEQTTAATGSEADEIDLLRVLKGVGWSGELQAVHVSRRGRDHPAARGNNGGFRLALDL